MRQLCPFPCGPDSFLLAVDAAIPLSRDISMRALRLCAEWTNRRFDLGLDCEALGNASSRRGGATWLHQCGVSDLVIKRLGRWRADAYQLYIDRSISTVTSAQNLLSRVGGHDMLADARRWLGVHQLAPGFDPWADGL